MDVMTTSHLPVETVHWFDRVVSWVLDHDGDIYGDIYGDERARLRWYEGLAFTASVQWILVLWVLAACAWTAPSSSAPYLWSIAAAFVIPMYLSMIYAARRGVNVTRPSRSRKSIVVQAATGVPLVVFVVGMTIGLDRRSGRSWAEMSPAIRGGAVGGCIGLAIAAVFVVWMRRRNRRRLAAGTDLD